MYHFAASMGRVINSIINIYNLASVAASTRACTYYIAFVFVIVNDVDDIDADILQLQQPVLLYN